MIRSKTIYIFNALLGVLLLFITLFSWKVVANYLQLERLSYNHSRLLSFCIYTTCHQMKNEWNSWFDSNEAEVKIDLEDRKWKELTANLPWSGQLYQKGQMLLGESQFPIKIKLHGDNFWHYYYEQKSYKVKIQNQQEYEGNHVYHFVNPRKNNALNNQLSYRLGKILGVLVPQSKLTTLAIDGYEPGIKICVEHLNGAFLKRNKLTSGILYKGENDFFKDQFYGVWKTLPDGAYLWDRQPFNESGRDREPLNELLYSLNHQDYDIWNLEAFARYSAALEIMNSYHYDDGHNLRLFFDSEKSQFSPVLWDPMGFSERWKVRRAEQPHEIITNHLLTHLFKNYRFLYFRQKALNDFYQNQQDSFWKITELELERAKQLAQTIPYTRNTFGEFSNRKETLESIERFRQNLRTSLAANRQTLCTDSSATVQYSKTEKGIRIRIDSKLPVEQLRFFVPGMENAQGICQVEYWLNDSVCTSNEKPVNVDQNGNVFLNQVLFPNINAKRLYGEPGSYQAKLSVQPGIYEIRFVGIDSGKIAGLEAVLMDYSASKIPGTLVNRIEWVGFYNINQLLSPEGE